MQPPPWSRPSNRPSLFWLLLSLYVLVTAGYLAYSNADNPPLKYSLFLSMLLLAARAIASERERLRREEFRRSHDFDKEFRIK